ncbi:LAGLIDADG family homing endonuclease [Patescibacteria group bacterium]|nr:LAGLIDADG family homing endonuclease [Patescibacteria group bacterium]MBU4274522.1 LAGLIDADG family homing endonuclease [Patescibacteria group bacterium]MBU4367427.1 LAGLIDADG family homing endonuclease [Patescibacteria group bacterium]MBU4461747.1 LAGLIDADG family homing endonuclease [Patescibacteria group bacterium]MCG2700131.1 LAGLIDADG family homing endonuclease [Candidatus Parcubacteria bacterium]
MRGYFRNTILNKDKLLQSYIIGLAIGDGNLSNPNGRATRLRITCDKKYPLLIKRIANSLKALLPINKVSIVNRKENCVDVSIFSNHLEKLLGWKAENGSKMAQKVSIPSWIKQKNEYKISCLKGLIETDGSIYSDRNYKMMMFTTIINKLAKDFYGMIVSLGFNPHIYRIERKTNIYNFNKQIEYNIRLSKNVLKFLDLVRPEKS